MCKFSLKFYIQKFTQNAGLILLVKATHSTHWFNCFKNAYI